MEFKSKIKSMTKFPLRGARLYPSQPIEPTSTKSIHFPQESYPFYQHHQTHNHAYTPQAQSEVLRFTHRHSTQLVGTRSFTSRDNLDESVKNKFTFNRLKTHGQISDHDSTISQGTNSQILSFNDALKKSNVSQGIINSGHLQNLKVHRAVSFEGLKTTQAASFQNVAVKEYFKHQSSIIGEEERQKMHISQDCSQKIYEQLYFEFKHKYQVLQEDNKKLRDQVKQLQMAQQLLISDRNRMRQQKSLELNQQMIQRNKKIGKLQQSINILRNINQILMKKQRDSLINIKATQEKCQQVLKLQQQNFKTTISLVSYKNQQILDKIEKDLKDLEAKLLHTQSILLKNTQQLNRQKYSLKIQQKKLNTQIDLMRLLLSQQQQKNSKMRESFQQIQSQNIQLKLQQEIIKKQKVEAYESLSAVDSENLRLDKANISLSQQNAALQDKIAKIQSKLNQNHNFQIQDLVSTNQKLFHQFNQLEERFNRLLQINHQLQSKSESFFNDNVQLTQKTNFLQGKVEWIQRAYNELQINNLEVQDEMVTLSLKLLNQKFMISELQIQSNLGEHTKEEQEHTQLEQTTSQSRGESVQSPKATFDQQAQNEQQIPNFSKKSMQQIQSLISIYQKGQFHNNQLSAKKIECDLDSLQNIQNRQELCSTS